MESALYSMTAFIIITGRRSQTPIQEKTGTNATPVLSDNTKLMISLMETEAKAVDPLGL